MKAYVYGFTLIEIVAVGMIVAVLATMLVPMFIKSIESAKNKEAIAALRLIRTAERLYYIEYKEYIFANSTSEINNKLDLDICSENWNFDVIAVSEFTVCASRRLSQRYRKICITEDGKLSCSPVGSSFCSGI